MKISRRNLLKMIGAATLGMALPDELLHALPKEGEWIPYEEYWSTGICLQCPSGCGLRIRSVNHWPVKLEGIKDYPINRGRLCPKGQAGLQVLYDPDRIRYPLRRKGKRGEGKWEKISWDEAIPLVTQRLQKLREERQPHQLLVLGGRYRGHMLDLMNRFMEAYGSPNHLGNPYRGSEGILKGHFFTMGERDFLSIHWEETNYVLSFGAALLEASRSSMINLRGYGSLRRGRPGIRGKLVQVEPRFSVTASKADQWIPIEPGTDGALALGMAHWIIKEKRYDQDFVSRYTFGFDDWKDSSGKSHIGFKTLVLKEYSPKQVSQATGIPEDRIIQIAREFSSHRPSIAISGRGVGMQTNGTYAQMAIDSLNALMGSIDRPGGLLRQRKPPFQKWPSVLKDPIAEKGLSLPRIDGAGDLPFPFAKEVPYILPEKIGRGEPYPIDTLLLYYTNPLFSIPESEKFRTALDKIPFIVSFSPFMDETTRFADLVLPDGTYLERWQDDHPEPGPGFPMVGLRSPVLDKPLHEVRNTGDVLIEIAKGLGGSVAKSFPWKDMKEALMEPFRGVFRSKRGSIRAKDLDEFWKALIETGGWWDDSYPFGEWRKRFNTPSERFEFYSQIMERDLSQLSKKGSKDLDSILKELKIEAKEDKAFLPHFEKPRLIGEEKDFPFHLIHYKLMTTAEGRGANQPFLQEIFGPHLRERWDSWVEINPETARTMGIKDGDPIWVESKVGKVKTKARLFTGTHPKCIHIPYGQGHRAYGRWAEGRGMNPNDLLGREYDYLGGFLSHFSTRVKVYKA
ncbi:MAG: molybdopterin-dependent oxidoreductase [Thermodesulfobacteriota bacterium]|nr:molybdopterin-dependent oxidoreductase [Thermodesulfobacteriota bacterium]